MAKFFRKITKINTIVGVLVGLYFFLSFFRPVEIEDIWWHLSAGRWIVENGGVPHSDPFPLTLPPSPWIFTQWLGSTFFYAVYWSAGLTGLKTVRALIFLAAALIFFRYGRKRAPLCVILILLVFLADGLNARCLLRPFIFNFIFIQIFLITLLDYYRDPQFKKLWVLPLLGILWSNLHLGSFVYGVMLIAAFGCSALLRSRQGEYFLRCRELFFILGAYAASLFFTPYGLAGFLYPFKVFLLPHFINFYRFNDIITEMQAPLYIFQGVDGVWFFALMAAGVTALFFLKKNQFPLTLLFITAVFMFLYSARGTALFAIVSLYVIVEALNEGSLTRAWESFQRRKDIERLLYGGLALILTIALVRIFNQGIVYENTFKRLLTLPVSAPNPASAIQFLKNHRIKGNVFANDTLGGYLIWSSYPHLRPVVDGRQLDQEHFRRFLDAVRSPQHAFDQLAEEYQIKIALLDAGSLFYDRLLQHLNAHPGWQFVFIDGPIVIFLKKGAFAIPTENHELQRRLREADVDGRDVDALKNLCAAVKPNPWQKVFVPEPAYVDFLEEGNLLFSLGYQGAGIRRVHQAMASADSRVLSTHSYTPMAPPKAGFSGTPKRGILSVDTESDPANAGSPNVSKVCPLLLKVPR